MLLRPEQEDAGIGCQNRALFGFEKGARILAHQDQTAAVLADPASQSDQESADRLLLGQEAGLVDEEVPRSTISPEGRPQPVGEQEVSGGNQFLTQVTKIEA